MNIVREHINEIKKDVNIRKELKIGKHSDDFLYNIAHKKLEELCKKYGRTLEEYMGSVGVEFRWVDFDEDSFVDENCGTIDFNCSNWLTISIPNFKDIRVHGSDSIMLDWILNKLEKEFVECIEIENKLKLKFASTNN